MCRPEQRKQYTELFEQGSQTIRELIDLFDTYEVPVTWAVVGRLVEPQTGIPSRYPYDLDVLFEEINTKLAYSEVPIRERYFPKLVQLLREARTKHEIASHTYNHLHCSKISSQNLEVFQRDLEAMQEVFEAYSLSPARSLVFPRNEIGGLEAINRSSIKIYRAPDQYWYSGFPKPLIKFFRQLDFLLPFTPQTFRVERDSYGNAFVCGSMLYTTTHTGYKKFIPPSMNAFRVRRGLDRAVRRREILHLWFHPFNYGFRKEDQFRGLESVLRYAAELRSRKLLQTVTMGSLVD